MELGMNEALSMPVLCRDNILLQQNSMLPELTFENNLGSLKLKRERLFRTSNL